MKNKIKITTAMIVVVICLVLGIENVLLRMEVASLIDEKETMEFELNEIKEIVSFNNSNEPPEREISFHSWQDSKEIAKKFVAESDGQFPKEWGLFLSEKAKEHAVDPYILFELIRVETGGTFEPDTVGPKTKYGRAYGLAQFMENTGPWIAAMGDLPYEKELLYDPYYSIQLATIYLDFLYERYEDWDHALTAYHRGIYGLEKFIDDQGHAKSWYADEIQQKAKKLEMVALDSGN